MHKIIAFFIISSFSVSADSGQMFFDIDPLEHLCLTRHEPLGNDQLEVDKIPIKEFVSPNMGKIVITSNASDACKPFDECFVSKWEYISLKGNELTWRMNRYKLRNSKNSDRPKFLVGEDPKKHWDIYLIYMGKAMCALNSGKLCNQYRFEVHPQGLTSYPRPDEAQQHERLNVSACGVVALQPGGGNGEDPP